MLPFWSCPHNSACVATPQYFGLGCEYTTRFLEMAGEPEQCSIEVGGDASTGQPDAKRRKAPMAGPCELCGREPEARII